MGVGPEENGWSCLFYFIHDCKSVILICKYSHSQYRSYHQIITLTVKYFLGYLTPAYLKVFKTNIYRATATNVFVIVVSGHNSKWLTKKKSMALPPYLFDRLRDET